MSQTLTPEEWRTLRRSRGDLLIAGKAMLAFGIWSSIKAYIGMFFNEDVLSGFFNEVGETTLSNAELLAVLFVITTILLLFIFAFHLAIYSGAKKESKGRKVSVFYLLITGLFFFLNVLSVAYSVISIYRDPSNFLFTYITSILFDLAIVGNCVDILINGTRCRRLMRRLKEGGAA